MKNAKYFRVVPYDLIALKILKFITNFKKFNEKRRKEKREVTIRYSKTIKDSLI